MSFTDSLCLSQTVSVCHRQSVSVKDSMCLSQTVCFCHIQSVSVSDSQISPGQLGTLPQVSCLLVLSNAPPHSLAHCHIRLDHQAGNLTLRRFTPKGFFLYLKSCFVFLMFISVLLYFLPTLP